MSTPAPMTRHEFLKFNPRWDSVDRRVLEEDLDAFGGVTFERVESGWNRYVAVYDADSKLLMHVARGTIYYAGQSRPGSHMHPNGQGHVYHLSTHRAGGSEAKPEADLGPLCMTCFLHHPDGACDR